MVEVLLLLTRKNVTKIKRKKREVKVPIVISTKNLVKRSKSS